MCLQAEKVLTPYTSIVRNSYAAKLIVGYRRNFSCTPGSVLVITIILRHRVVIVTINVGASQRVLQDIVIFSREVKVRIKTVRSGESNVHGEESVKINGQV